MDDPEQVPPATVTDAAPFITALSLAFYALHDQLVESGALAPGQVSGALRRFDPGPGEGAKKVAAIIATLADNLSKMQFGDAGSSDHFDLN